MGVRRRKHFPPRHPLFGHSGPVLGPFWGLFWPEEYTDKRLPVGLSTTLQNPKVRELAKMAQNGQNGLKWPKMAKMAQNSPTQRCVNWPKKAQNGPKRPRRGWGGGQGLSLYLSARTPTPGRLRETAQARPFWARFGPVLGLFRLVRTPLDRAILGHFGHFGPF